LVVMDRRKFLKYAGATGAVVGASALGLNYLSKPQSAPPSQGTTTATATTTAPSTAILPMITRLTYEPSRILNSKIYDIRVDLKISDPARRLSSVLVALEPVAYAHLPTDAFPQEETKTAALQSPGLEKEILSTVFSDLKGGREYDVRAGAADSSGVVDERTLRTEYVREFENIAALDDMTVIADYYPWYEKPSVEGNHWRDGDQEINGPSQHIDTPLLGEYASGDPIVISKHIDWATGHGIDAFCMSWWTTGNDERTWDYHNTRNLEAFLKNPLAKDMQFCILYENNGRLKVTNPDDPAEKWIEDLDDPFNKGRLVSDFEYLTKYFSSPQYLEIDGRPCVRFDYTVPFRGDIKGVLGAVRIKLRATGWDVYLINDLAGRSEYPSDLISATASGWRYPNISSAHVLQVIENTDALGGSTPPLILTPPKMNFDGAYKMWRDFSMKYGKDSIPVAWPGSIDTPRSPEYFENLLEPSIVNTTKATIEVVALNGWETRLQIEPAEEYGLTYLEVLKEVLAKTKT